MEWDWIGTKDAHKGIATYCSGTSKVVLPIPSFEKAHALARLIDERCVEAVERERNRLRTRFYKMLDET